MHYFHIADRRYAQFERLRTLPGLTHAFATRPLDVSARTDAQAPQRTARRAQMAEDLMLDPAGLHYCVQIHQTGLARVAHAEPGRAREELDGLFTDARGMPLMTFSADCPLVLVWDARQRVLGMCHASWRCTVGSITRLLIERMRDELHTDAADVWAGIGPSAGPCCYEVKDDVRLAARAAIGDPDGYFPRRDERMFFDLWQANRDQLRTAGVPAEQIEICGVCTMCRTDLFYSFRREGAGCGHFGLMAAIV